METNKNFEKTVMRMDTHSDSKIWYKFVNHSLRSTTHTKSVNRVRLVLLHCITTFNTFNVVKFIVNEIHAY